MPEVTHLIEINTLPRADAGNVLTPNASVANPTSLHHQITEIQSQVFFHLW